MAAETQPRISVVQRDRMVPLLPGPAAPVRREQLWRGVLLERHAVEAIEIPEHEHRDLCLHLQLSGAPELEWWSEGQNRVERTGPGSAILLAAGTRDRLRWSARSERLVVSVKPQVLQAAADGLGTRGAVDFANQWSLRDPALGHVLLEMAREAEAGFALGRLYAELMEMRLAETLLRRHGDGLVLRAEAGGGLPLPKLRRVLEFMTANLHRDLLLADIAREAGLSAFHFARAFRTATRGTPHQYLLEQRVAEAQRMLLRGDLPVQEIALRTGFGSASNFVRSFRKRVGTTPAAWKLVR